MAAVHSRSPLRGVLPEGLGKGGLVWTDLTLAPRAGVKGQGARAWLEAKGYGPLPLPNRAARHAAGPMVVMLGESEALLLDAGSSAPLWSFGTGAALAPRVYPMPRAEGTFWTAVSGAGAADMFASLCGVDLRAKSFGDLQVAQTMIAKTNAIVIRDDAVGFHLLGDISTATYLARQLLAAPPSG